jgi:hypothetical protein
MSNYKIHRWDVVMSGNSNVQAPMIYVEPDTTFLQFARENNFAVVCTISGTDTMYDGKQIPGIVSLSADVPSCRPNFYTKTGLYVVRLWANWYGYPHPEKLGDVIFSGLKGGAGAESGNKALHGKEAEGAGTESGNKALHGKEAEGGGDGDSDILRRHDLVKDHKHAGSSVAPKQAETGKAVIAPSTFSISKGKEWQTWLITAGVVLLISLSVGLLLHFIRSWTSRLPNPNPNLLSKNIAGN